ncbi:MAG TPA: D-glycero-beta-D-manno-heptose 1-phosphate adenylyltransferase [Dehalococcoidia bacterium]|nr:D-glycero-beta-D-manno-heptose 1-phosphate adenylyltransferase [Dehalococcoidia bacterium]
MSGLLETIDALRGLRIAIIGEAMLDAYLEGTAGRICREAPVPIVDIERRTDAPGGAANTAVNLAALGAEARFVSVLGADPEGNTVMDALRSAGVDSRCVLRDEARRTLAKQRVVAGSQLLVRFDYGTTAGVGHETEQRLIEALRQASDGCDALVVSDYGYGVLTPAVIRTVAAIESARPRPLVVDAHNLPAYRALHPTAVKPNYDETARLLGLRRVDGPDARAEQVAASGERLLDMTGARIAAITLDADGALLFERDAPPYRTYARPTRQSRAAGAGDTFVAALACALAAGASGTEAAELASAAAAVVVGKEGTSACGAGELRAYLTAEGKQVGDLDAFRRRTDFYRAQGRRIVFTNGCFDILHRGHITYLNRAKALGDLLIVGINSDESVQRLKGDERPINSLEDRVQVLSALSCVDHIVPFAGDTPVDVIRAVRPHVFVKGGDYTRETLPEAQVVEELGGVVQILPYLDDRSTSRIIERIQRNGEDRDGADRRRDGSGVALAARAQRAVHPAGHDR